MTSPLDGDEAEVMVSTRRVGGDIPRSHTILTGVIYVLISRGAIEINIHAHAFAIDRSYCA